MKYKKYKPKKKSDVKELIRLHDRTKKIWDESPNWSTLSLDTFMFMCLSKRGVVGADHRDYIAHLRNHGTDRLLDLARSKVMGWENYAKLSNYPKGIQDNFVTWYKNHAPHEREEAKNQGVKNIGKTVLNRYFVRHGIGITIS